MTEKYMRLIQGIYQVPNFELQMVGPSNVVAMKPNTYDNSILAVTSGGILYRATTDDDWNTWIQVGRIQFPTPKEKIVFASDRSGNWDIWMMDPDGTNLEQLTTDSSSDTSPQISPAGTKIAFLSYRTGSWQVWMMNSDGSDQHQLFDVNELPIPYVYVKSVECPTWAPDGSYLISNIGLIGIHSAPWSAIYRHNPDGSDPQIFLDWGPSIKGRFRISSDGSKFVYCRENSNYWAPTLKICVGDIVNGVVDSSSIYELSSTNDGYSDKDVIWFPDDTKIMWRKSNNPQGWNRPFNLYSMNIDETDITKLTNYAGAPGAYEPDFSPDGQRVVFRFYDSTTTSLYTMNPDGSDIKPLLVDEYINTNHCWGIIAYELTATINIKPETLNLKSKGLFTAFITLPEPYNITDINISTVVCEGAPAVKGVVADDNKYIAKFDRGDLREDLQIGDEVTLTVTGNLYDGNGLCVWITPFEGSDTIRVIGE